ncbi:MAG TPA: anti-sigma factor antagonist [Sedimenticola thiotaurini]|uniref:Anti-sigma factor antagonist n=1 Tax=Sedimenticola thiotaurini TaxID=1543721 RepID=A0A831W6I4_9GAMM|nr:anti-sigma factor antagonist [Sedimenticola thiotaurini]
MTITSNRSSDGRELTIGVEGRFDFSSHQSFREACSQGDPERTRFIIDLSRTDYVDSSALGMLLLLRQRTGGGRDRIRLRGFGPEVRRIFEISHFDQLFDMEPAP